MVFTEFFTVFITTAVSVAVLFCLTKIMGNKQISQLNLFDYITGITIGSIAAEAAINLDETFWYCLEAMAVYGLLSFFITLFSAKKPLARRFLVGYPILLYDNGVFYRENFRRAKVDICDFLTLARSSGYFDMKLIQTAVIEYNGTVSFLPVAKYEPPTAEDVGVSVGQDRLVANVVFDGKPLPEGLRTVGRDCRWLEKTAAAQGVKDLKRVYLATCDSDGNLCVYPYSSEKKAARNLE